MSRRQGIASSLAILRGGFLSAKERMAGSARATRWRCGGHRDASASTSTRRSTWRISKEFPLPSGRGRADRCRLHHRAACEVGGQQPRQEADPSHRRQRPLSSRSCDPAVAGETRLPHHARLPARLCTPSQRYREVMGCHAPRSDPQQVPCELQPLRRSHLRFLSPTNATRVEKMARYRHR